MPQIIVQLVLSIILIIGVYQFYFWCQRHPLTAPRELKLPLDERIPYWPVWVWIYDCLYYPMILYINWVTTEPKDFMNIAFSFMMLLLAQMAFFTVCPVSVPEAWRERNRKQGWSERFLAFVQSFDARSNSFPSMHTSVAMLTALYLQPQLGLWVFAFPVLISLSCLFTKQHYLVDVPAGAALGWAVFHFRAV